MSKMKETNKYYFSVEGETELWYLEWLEKQINGLEDSKYKVSFNVKIQNSPLKRTKAFITTSDKIVIYHVCDVESQEECHVKKFQKVLTEMKDSHKIKSAITYKLAYSNYSFELWMVLHKNTCNGALSHRKSYLDCINSAFNVKYQFLHDYKKESNFKNILAKIQITDVYEAINRAKTIEENNQKNEKLLIEHKGYYYYAENPSLSINQVIEKILNDCSLI
ncbi:MAG: RloB domain-containing protein [Anaerofustis sp.]